MSQYFLIFWCALTLFGCGPVQSQIPTDDDNISLSESYVLTAMAPITDIIPNWDDVRVRPGNLFLGSDGKELEPYYAPNHFKCENIDPAQYDMVSDGGIYVPRAIASTRGREQPLFLPPRLEKKLTKLKSKLLTEVNFNNQEIRSLGLGYPVRDFLRLRGGWLVAFDGGEFGGSLIWLRDIGAYRVVSHSNTHDILLYDQTIYAGVGGSHFGYHNSAILKIHKTLFGFNVETVKTPRPVLALKEYNKNILGLMNHGFLRLTQEEGVTEVFIDYEGGKGVRLYRFGLLPDGHAYVAGENFIGIYDNLTENLTPKLYIPQGCSPVFPTVRPVRKF